MMRTVVLRREEEELRGELAVQTAVPVVRVRHSGAGPRQHRQLEDQAVRLVSEEDEQHRNIEGI